MNEVVSLSMLPVEEGTLFREVSKKFITEMPRVVPDQRSKFENDELFRKLSREGEVRVHTFLSSRKFVFSLYGLLIFLVHTKLMDYFCSYSFGIFLISGKIYRV